MVVRLHSSIRTLPVALPFASYNSMSTFFTQSYLLNNQVEANGKFSNVDSVTGRGTDTANQDAIGKNDIPSCNNNASFSSMTNSSSSTMYRLQQSGISTPNLSINCSKQSDFVNDELLCNTNYKGMLEEFSLPTSFGKQESSKFKNVRLDGYSLKNVHGSRNRKSKNHKSRTTLEPFDIYQSDSEGTEKSDSETEYFVFMSSSRYVDDSAEECKVDGLIEEPVWRVLRPGMVLLKKYVSFKEQVSIVRKCRELGLGPGGFYNPGYKDRAKLRLYMMCLGMDWDPQTRKYQKQRRIDRAKPPDIPSEFHMLLAKAMHDSFSLIREDSNVSEPEEILPQMTPDICIVNFYTETGRLGLHQDRDESSESLSKGLPVISLSIGDSAEFLYGDQRDAEKAEKLVLESGDVLIFGGESRHVFHGISSIIPDSAPPFLLEHTRFRPGRLNLTFRQY